MECSCLRVDTRIHEKSFPKYNQLSIAIQIKYLCRLTSFLKLQILFSIRFIDYLSTFNFLLNWMGRLLNFLTIIFVHWISIFILLSLQQIGKYFSERQMHRERTNIVRGSFVQIEIITQFGIIHKMELKIYISQCRKIWKKY